MAETYRQYLERYEKMDLEERRRSYRARNATAEAMLRLVLQPGDRIRAVRAQCCAHEATYRFSHWRKSVIVSRSGREILPGSVQSVRGLVLGVPRGDS